MCMLMAHGLYQQLVRLRDANGQQLFNTIQNTHYISTNTVALKSHKQRQVMVLGGVNSNPPKKMCPVCVDYKS